MTRASRAAWGAVLLLTMGVLTCGCRGKHPLDFTPRDAGPPQDASLDGLVPCTVPGDCQDDGNPCTDAPECINNWCVYPSTAAGTSCDDGVFCNGTDTCDGAGNCVSSGDPCAGGTQCNDVCDETNDTCFAPSGTAMVALSPWARAAKATLCPWLPVEAVNNPPFR